MGRRGQGGRGPLEELQEAGLAGVERQLGRDGDGEHGDEDRANEHGEDAEEAAQVGLRVNVAVAHRALRDHNEPQLVPEVELLPRASRSVSSAAKDILVIMGGGIAVIATISSS